MSKLTIVVPILDHVGELEPILDYLHFEKPEYPVLFIDRGSASFVVDRAQQWVQEHSHAQLYLMDAGTTPGQAYNKAIEICETDYLLFLRHFVLPTQDDWVEQLVAVMDEDPDVGSVAPLLLDPNQLASMTGMVYMRGMPTAADAGQPQSEPRVSRVWDFKAFRDGCLLVRRDALLKVGGYGVPYQATHYDYDLTTRLTKCGYRNRYCPTVKMRHWGNPWNADVDRMSPDAAHFWRAMGGIGGLDALNDVKEYYGAGYNFPAIERWSNTQIPEIKGKIVCFLADHDGCGSYRVKNPYRGLVFRGWEVTFTTFADTDAIDWADVIVLQRQMAETSFDLLRYAQGYRKDAAGNTLLMAPAKPVIYEVDDFFHGLHESNPVTPQFYNQPDWLRNMERMIYQSSALTVSTPELARQYGRFNSNTHIIANHLDLGAIPQPIRENLDPTVRIGWAGSGTHDADMPLAISALTRVLQENQNAVAVFIGADYRHLIKDVPLNQMEWLPATFGREVPVDDYYGILNEARLDVGLAPIADTIFNRCKCVDASTLIMTSEGVIPAGQLTESHRVWNQGTWHQVQAVEASTPRMGLAFTTEDGYQLKLTPEHRMLVDGVWKEARDIVCGESFQLQSELDPNEQISYQEVVWPTESRMSRIEPTTLKELQQYEDMPHLRVGPRFGRLLGAIAGDGSVSKTALKIHCDGIDQDWIEQLQEDFSQLGLRATTQATKTYDGKILRRREVRVASASLLRVLESLNVIADLSTGRPKRVLEIPQVIWSSPKNVRLAYLQGLFETDGTVAKMAPPSFVSKSERLARDVQRLALTLGMVVSVKQIRNAAQDGMKRPYWLIRMRRAAADTLLALGGGFCSARKQHRLEDLCSRPTSNAYRPMQWEQEITAIEPCLITPIDLQCEGSVFSAAGFISHNSDIKLVEYGAYGIATVASDVEPYSLFEKHSKHPEYGRGVFLARSERDWYKYLNRLVTEPQVRIAMGRAAQHYVWHTRGVEKMCDQIETLCLDLIAGKRHIPKQAEPVHSLNVSYFNNMTAKQAEHYHKLWTQQQRAAQKDPVLTTSESVA